MIVGSSGRAETHTYVLPEVLRFFFVVLFLVRSFYDSLPRIEVPRGRINPTDMSTRKKLDLHHTPCSTPCLAHRCMHYQVYMCIHTVHDTTNLLYTSHADTTRGIDKWNMTPGAALVEPTCWSCCFAQYLEWCAHPRCYPSAVLLQ